jgi:hypothetical protein
LIFQVYSLFSIAARFAPATVITVGFECLAQSIFEG